LAGSLDLRISRPGRNTAVFGFLRVLPVLFRIFGVFTGKKAVLKPDSGIPVRSAGVFQRSEAVFRNFIDFYADGGPPGGPEGAAG
jgi:hypothetical protein